MILTSPAPVADFNPYIGSFLIIIVIMISSQCTHGRTENCHLMTLILMPSPLCSLPHSSSHSLFPSPSSPSFPSLLFYYLLFLSPLSYFHSLSSYPPDFLLISSLSSFILNLLPPSPLFISSPSFLLPPYPPPSFLLLYQLGRCSDSNSKHRSVI